MEFELRSRARSTPTLVSFEAARRGELVRVEDPDSSDCANPERFRALPPTSLFDPFSEEFEKTEKNYAGNLQAHTNHFPSSKTKYSSILKNHSTVNRD